MFFGLSVTLAGCLFTAVFLHSSEYLVRAVAVGFVACAYACLHLVRTEVGKKRGK